MTRHYPRCLMKTLQISRCSHPVIFEGPIKTYTCTSSKVNYCILEWSQCERTSRRRKCLCFLERFIHKLVSWKVFLFCKLNFFCKPKHVSNTEKTIVTCTFNSVVVLMTSLPRWMVKLFLWKKNIIFVQIFMTIWLYYIYIYIYIYTKICARCCFFNKVICKKKYWS